ncbi:hypothetical protein CH373_07905 [Leptospira perolatii]|uniref:Uncharacterized protein n=1 Tax=Leptospira perolatii TaxID=2023191 RepID=A0A2M9ZN21_9LEPT|nr:hypothetical protein [Leptospira perolatii]PJZ68947.1 hypothetical protein CH360_13810 [Leptospira perolatii]PJZ73435.1 hypothetical protein CH373_07905 [Leptospira perolatii]
MQKEKISEAKSSKSPKYSLSQLFRKEDQELIRLENSMVRAISELRTKELKQVKLSDGFEKRLQNMLQEVSFEEESFLNKIARNFVWNKSFQYSLTAGLAILVLAVAIGRFSSSPESYAGDRSGTLAVGSGERDFVDVQSSAKFGTNMDSKYLMEISKNPEGKRVLSSLQMYFMERGDELLANEIQKVLDSAYLK